MAILREHPVENLFERLVESESSQLLQQAGVPSSLTFRFNSLKHNRAFQERMLQAEDFTIRPSSVEGAFEQTSPGRSIGKSLAHFLGDIYIQDPASMVPPLVLGARPGEVVLDLCASPGSKTTQIAAMMQNGGILVANDISTRRLRALIFNLRRIGAVNTIMIQSFGEQLGNHYFETFDRVLVDPPCSALGTLRKSPEILNWWQEERSRRLAVNQRNLLLSGLKALKPGGVLVYSTCTLHPLENEAVINSVLRSLPVQLEGIPDVGLKTRPGLTEFGTCRFHDDLSCAIRIYPHENASEGFFVARLRKLDHFGKSRLRKPKHCLESRPTSSHPEVSSRLTQLRNMYGLPEDLFEKHFFWLGSELALCAPGLGHFPLYREPVRAGLPIAHIKRGEAKLTTEGSHLLGSAARRSVVELDSLGDLEAYVNRRSIACSVPTARQVLVRFSGEMVGHALIDNGKLLSRFPRIGWEFDLTGS